MSHTHAVSIDQVKNNFSRYGLLDERVVFLKGWYQRYAPLCINQTACNHEA